MEDPLKCNKAAYGLAPVGPCARLVLRSSGHLAGSSGPGAENFIFVTFTSDLIGGDILKNKVKAYISIFCFILKYPLAHYFMRSETY